MKPVTDADLAEFLEKLNAMQVAHMSVAFPSLTPRVYTAMKGDKYARIVEGDRGSVYCFIDLATGDILKSASWKAPAKGARGTIWSDHMGMGYLGPYGAQYKTPAHANYRWVIDPDAVFAPKHEYEALF